MRLRWSKPVSLWLVLVLTACDNMVVEPLSTVDDWINSQRIQAKQFAKIKPLPPPYTKPTVTLTGSDKNLFDETAKKSAEPSEDATTPLTKPRCCK